MMTMGLPLPTVFSESIKNGIRRLGAFLRPRATPSELRREVNLDTAKKEIITCLQAHLDEQMTELEIKKHDLRATLPATSAALSDPSSPALLAFQGTCAQCLNLEGEIKRNRSLINLIRSL